MNASLFPTAGSTITPATPTKQQIQKALPSLLAAKSRADYLTLCRIQKSGIAVVWDNPNGLTPQEAVDAMGTTAGLVFQAHGALTTLITELAGFQTDQLRKFDANAAAVVPDIELPTHAWTVNADGTITVLEAAYGG